MERDENIDEILAKLEKIEDPVGFWVQEFALKGTTWLKSLIFSIVNRNNINPLFTTNPHDLILMLGLSLPMETMIKPRLLNTHVHPSLPPSIKNPLDVFVSHWHFAHRIFGEDDNEPCHLEECFDICFVKESMHLGHFGTIF
ncbi:hypothetical protein G4B88_022188 [Cannabis sativa]|uniref:Sulfotransferase n=1 Tax=Cannabis sativa TaxID=3483 RepID=A0A7J6FXR6_CANSA|nr:hypothetical protein G4B88_022188 [Cannabis sativa]